jgi:Spy/CpxP family protein refolding chaperone
MKRISVFLILGAALLVGGVAIAHRCGHHGGKAMIGKVIDGALDAAKATQPQRAAIEAARDHVFDTIEANKHDHEKDMQEAIALFSAPTLDQKALEAHRQRKVEGIQKIGDAIVQAISDAHDALTPPQRKAVADYLRDQRAQHEGAHANWREGFFKKIVDNRTQAAFDAIGASDAQKSALTADRDRVFEAFKDMRMSGAQVDKLLELFSADTLDRTQLAALRAEHDARMKKIGDALVGALSDVHAQLSADQRTKLIDWVKQHHREHDKG